MSISGAITKLFKVYGESATSDRAAIYIEALSGERDITVEAAVTKVMREWRLVSLPPIGRLLEACEKIRLADEEYRKRNERQAELAAPTQAQQALEVEHMRLMAELFDAGFMFCDVAGRWLPNDQAKLLPPEQSRGPSIAQTRAAVEALRAGKLGTGSPGMIAFRAGMRAWKEQKPAPRKPRGRATGHGMTLLADALKDDFGITPAQSEVFD